MKDNKPPYYIRTLLAALDKARQKNPRYSMRALAARLEIQASELSRALTLKKPLSPSTALKALKRLGLTGEEQRLFMQSVLEERQKDDVRHLESEIPKVELCPIFFDGEDSANVFNLDAHAIMQLTFVEGFLSHPKWIAARLNLPIERVQNAILALLRHGLLRQENGRLFSSNKNFSALLDDKTDAIRRQHQKEILLRAIGSLEKDDFHQRAHYGLTVALDPNRLADARDMIVSFLTKLNDFLECGAQTEVYQCGIQLYPLSRLRVSGDKLE
ncbi:MAG: TIGR02147 family protein [Bdellovibrionales bacterium]